jgi:hypothetical protein
MFEVIVSTISTGRVQRKTFDHPEKANRHARGFDAKRSKRGARIYRVEVLRRDLPVQEPTPKTLPAAA